MSSNFNLFYWKPSVLTDIKGDKKGTFEMKVSENTPGARLKVWEFAGKKGQHYVVDAQKLSGQLVWVDKTYYEVNGATVSQLLVALKTNQGNIHILQTPLELNFLRVIVNSLFNLPEGNISIVYEVWKKMVERKPVFYDDGTPIYGKALKFEGVRPVYNLGKELTNNYWEMREQRGLVPAKKINSKGQSEYDDSAEMKFLDEILVKLMTKVLHSGKAVPFAYNSWICGQAENPGGGGNLSEEDKALCRTLYENMLSSGMYKMFGAQNTVDADSVVAGIVNPAEPAVVAPPMPIEVDEPRGKQYDYEPGNPDDLPF